MTDPSPLDKAECLSLAVVNCGVAAAGPNFSWRPAQNECMDLDEPRRAGLFNQAEASMIKQYDDDGAEDEWKIEDPSGIDTLYLLILLLAYLKVEHVRSNVAHETIIMQKMWELYI